MTEYSNTMDMQPAKRQKVDVACDLCRSKKIKCDSVRPVCGPCMKRKNSSTPCSWEGSVFRNQQPSRAEMLRLRRRIKELESHAVEQRNQNNDNNDSNDNADRNVSEPSQVQAVRGVEQDNVCAHVSGVANAGRRTGLLSPGRNPATPISCARTEDSMRNPSVTERVSFEPPTGSTRSSSVNTDFYGGSSAVGFLSQMRNAVHQKLGISDLTTPTDQEDIQTHILGVRATQRYKLLQYVLPGRRQADKLLSVYWDIVHPLYPFLDKQEFLARYENLWVHQESDEEDPIFLCVLNLVFALSSQLNGDVSPSERHASADSFFERAKESLDLWHLNTLQSVQMLLLLSIYLQSVCAINQGWMMIGVAIRTAQSLGLHLHETSRQITSQEKQELAGKVWHTCVLLDRMAAMTYGRPSMSTVSTTTKDDRRLPCHDPPSATEFLSQSLRLFEISDEILGGFYPDHVDMASRSREPLDTLLERTTAGNKRSILDIDRKLLEWEDKLPPHLRFKQVPLDSEGISCTFTRQATILRQQFLHIRLLSMRPILSAYLSFEGGGGGGGSLTGSSLCERIALQCSVLCVNIARETIDISYSQRPSDASWVGLTEAWWHNVLFIYSAATVLMAAKLSPDILSEIPAVAISESWSRANAVLQSFHLFNPTIRRMVEALDLVYQIIPENCARSAMQMQQFGFLDVDAQEVPGQSQGQAQSQGQGLPPQDSLGAAQPADRQRISNLADYVGDDAMDHDILFGINNFSWLTAMPFEL
ncbi:C6 transcription factor [Stemphylium lycopersici]|uniref:C6 transcription factor n=1 Tax=Stemphylium lycopersici TaxID=183478 RepID=A0A364N7A3_STELY|nr:C6 transcription factor [Stemphylium lycopersici]